MIKIYDRESQTYYTEVQYGEKMLNCLYHTVWGRIMLKLIANRNFSRLNAIYNSSKLSVSKIKPFIEKYNIQMSDFESKEYRSFNDFFTRSMLPGKRNIGMEPERLIAPADSKLLVYHITESLKINVKNSVYSMDEILRDRDLPKEYENGLCLVFRLTVDDYHRYCYIDSGEIVGQKRIKGKLHTVSSISKDYKVYVENQREYQVIDTNYFGRVVQMEVGAMLIGKIVNAPSKLALRGQEKGYFSYGGSTVLVFIKANRVSIDADIMKHSQEQIETRVKYGEAIGKIIC
jgi:phosphatidylserine decarboxylase